MASTLMSAYRASIQEYALSLQFKAYIESMKVVLRDHPTTTVSEVPPALGHRYRGDLTFLLMELGVPAKDHYIVMRVNDLDSIHDVDERIGSLYIPSRQLLDQVMSVYKAANKK